MAELIDRMLNFDSGHWTPAEPFPAVLDDGRQEEDEHAAARVRVGFHHASLQGGFTELKEGAAFPRLGFEYPILGVTIDSRVDGSISLADEWIGCHGGLMLNSPDEFEAQALSIGTDPFYYGPVIHHRAGEVLVTRSRVYAEGSAHTYNHYVGNHSDEMRPRKDVPDSRMVTRQKSGQANIVLPQLKVGGRYRMIYEGNRGAVHTRIVGAQVLWLAQGDIPVYTRPHPEYQSPGKHRLTD